MTTRADALLAYLEELGIDAVTHEHPPVYTVDEAERHTGHLPGAHTKNLFLEDKKGGLWLVTCANRQNVKVNALARLLEAPRFSFAGPDRLMQAMGLEPGAVTPLGLFNDHARAVQPVLDEKLLEHELLNCHPLRNDRTTALKPRDLLGFFEALGYRPRRLDLDLTARA